MLKSTAWLLLAAGVLSAEVAYQKPPQEILEVLNAPASPLAIPNPARTHVMLAEPRLYPTIAEQSAPMLRLAGLRINPANHGRHSLPLVVTALSVKDIASGRETKLVLPAAAASPSRSGAPMARVSPS